jgi:hypothetical protein
MCHQGALLVRNDAAFGSGNHLAVTRFTLLLVCAMAGMSIFLRPVRSTRWACMSDEHGGCWPPAFGFVVDQQ